MRPLQTLLLGLFFGLSASLSAQLRLPVEPGFPLLLGGAAAGPMFSWRSGGGENIVSFGEGSGRFATIGLEHRVAQREYRVTQREYRVTQRLAGQSVAGDRWSGSGDSGVRLSSSLLQPSTAPAAAPRPFDFTRTAPHLAFFCRLEINEKAGNVIPAKFRLGGHSYWQDNLMRR